MVGSLVFVFLIASSHSWVHHGMSRSGDVDRYWNENETPRGWVNSFGRINFDDDVNETIPEREVDWKHNNDEWNESNVTVDLFGSSQEGYDGHNGSEVHSEERRHRLTGNQTGIPADLFFQWWSAVRPFGNEMATKPKFPWMVSVQSRRLQMNSHLCSGNILTKLYVLSSCRCLSIPTGSAVIPLTPKDPSHISIVAGVSMLDIPLKEQLFYGQIRNAVGINIHPHCTLNHKFDYGVIELEYYVYYTDRVLPIPNLYDTFRGQSSPTGRVPKFMKPDDICQAAGWPSEKIFGNDDADGQQKVNDFVILEEVACLGTTAQVGHQLVCTKVVNGSPWNTITGQSGDIGSGLVCGKRVVAILSHHSGGRAVFASLRPALNFFWQYYQDQNEIYAISSGQMLAIPVTAVFLAFHVPLISTAYF